MQKAFRILGITIIALALLLGVYAVVAYLGWQSGQRLRTERAAQEQSAEVARQTELARSDIEQRNYGLASRRLEWILEQDAANVDARRLQAEVANLSDQQEVATPVVVATPIDIVTPMPGEDPEIGPAGRLSALQELFRDEEWSQAIAGLTAFQREHPDYERRTTDVLLFEAYITHGSDLLYTDQAELGLFYLRQAEQLGELPQEADDQRQWATLYLSGISFYDVNWDVAIFYFRELCLSAPFFHDSCDRLEEALVTYADNYAARQDWCPAETLLAEAYGIYSNNEVAVKLGTARAGCAVATPVLGATITGTVPITGSLPLTGTLPGPPPAIDGP